MIRCLNALFCKEVRVEDDGLMTLASIYSELSRKDLPVKARLCFVCFLELSLIEYEKRGAGEIKLRVLVFAPWGPTIGDDERTAFFQKASETIARGALIVDYGELPFMEFGQYSFEVFWDKERVCAAALDVVPETRTGG